MILVSSRHFLCYHSADLRDRRGKTNATVKSLYEGTARSHPSLPRVANKIDNRSRREPNPERGKSVKDFLTELQPALFRGHKKRKLGEADRISPQSTSTTAPSNTMDSTSNEGDSLPRTWPFPSIYGNPIQVAKAIYWSYQGFRIARELWRLLEVYAPAIPVWLDALLQLFM